MSEWIEITPTTEYPFPPYQSSAQMPEKAWFLACDENGDIDFGFTARDFYDSKYYLPIPKLPLVDLVVTNDDFVSRILNE